MIMTMTSTMGSMGHAFDNDNGSLCGPNEPGIKHRLGVRAISAGASAMWMPLYRRRCVWCGRMWRYFGEEHLTHTCKRCRMWWTRNRCCQIKNSLCSQIGVAGNTRIWLAAWPRILDMVCGSIRELDIYVQERIWLRVLLGPTPEDSDSSSSEDDDDEYCIGRTMLPGIPDIWKLWVTELSQGCRALVPRHNDECVNRRPIMVILSFLGPFSDFGLADGSRWNRGWRWSA